MCIVSCPNIVQITMCFFVTPRHRCVIMHEVDAYKDRFYYDYQLSKARRKVGDKVLASNYVVVMGNLPRFHS